MASFFHPVTPELLEDLKKVVGEKYVRYDEDTLEQYQTDEEGNPHFFKKPEVVVFPGSTEEVAAIVKLANQYLVPITPRAAGSGVACGAIPIYHGMVVELERMNQILELNADAMYAVVQTGVYCGQLQEEAKKHGLLYAADPSSASSSQVGGNVANNAGGNKAVKYGTTRNQIYALKVVTPTGDIVDVGARLQKCSTGLALEQLFAGSEGTLGIITEITVKLRPLPPYSFNMVCVFKTDEEAFALPNKILKAGVDPTSLEYMDNEAIVMTEKYLDMHFPHADEGACYVIVTVETFTEDELYRKMELLCNLAEENGSIDEFEADERIWKLRKEFAEAARAIDKMFQTEDFVVPLDKIGDMTKQIPELRKKYGLYCVTVETFTEDELDRKMELLCDLAEENGSIDEFEADERIWKLRKEFAEAARAIDKMFQTEDFVVPLDKIGDMTKQIPELREKYGLYCVTVAHIGDGNIHVLPLNKYGLTPDEWFEKIKAFHADLFPRVYALGGKMSGEHGVGYKKLEEFARNTPEGEVKIIKAIKRALDPNNIMNPGKLVDMNGDFIA